MFKRLYGSAVARKIVHRQWAQTKPNESLWKMIETKNIKSAEDWKNVRTEILSSNGPFTSANIDAMTIGVCTSKKEYDLALSYLEHLKEENIKLNLATIGKYFKLLYEKGIEDKLTPKDEEIILTQYSTVRNTHPVLDSITLESIIQAVSITKEWKLCLDLLKEIKVTAAPSSYAYSVIVAAAFLNNKEELAWQLLEEMIENDRTIQPIVFSSYFKKLLPITESRTVVEEMFNFLQKNCVKLEPSSVDEIVDSLKKLNLIARSSVVHQSGICNCCKKKLATFDITNDEFNDLKSQIVENVIVGKDIFHKTTAEELKRFKAFISNLGPHNVVLDGLNIAYSAGVKQPPYVTSEIVASVVAHFAKQGKKVLLFGRNHIRKWPKKNWDYIQENSTVFLTHDLSQDDPYILFSALHCGKNTIIVTRDLMRSHKFLLKDFTSKVLFDRWLTQRQYFLLYIQENGVPKFKKPLPYSQIAQRNEEYWHIPCTSTTKIPTTNTNWLCMKL